jgi:hypothetical protein
VNRTEPRQASARGGDHALRTVAPDPPHRPLRSGGLRLALATGLCVGAVLVATLPGPSASASGEPTVRAAGSATHVGDNLTLVRQSPWVGPRPPNQDLTLGLRITSRAPRSALSLTVSVYHHLTTRSAFTETLGGKGLGAVLARSPSIPVSSLPTDGQGVTTLTIPVEGDTTPAASTTKGSWLAQLGCAPGSCADVYPVKINLADAALAGASGTQPGTSASGAPGSAPSEAQLVTYLVYDDPSSSSQPLRFALVIPLGLAPPVAGRNGQAAAPNGPALARLDGLLGAIGSSGVVPLTLIPDAATVAWLQSTNHTRTVSTLDALSDSPARLTLAQSFVPVDATGLVDAGLGAELDAQLARAATVLGPGGAAIRTSRGTWVASAPVDQTTLDRLASAYDRVVVPQGGVSGPSGPLTITQPFSLTTGKGAAPTAMVSDAGLAAQLDAAGSVDPALTAEQLFADLSLIYYERPNLRGPTGAAALRGVAAVAPFAWAPDPTFLTAVLAGLLGNPVVEPVTLDQLFAQVAVGADDQPTTRRPASGSGSGLPARALRAARARESSFAAVATGAPAGAVVVQRLDDLLLAAESDALSARRQTSAVAGFNAALDHQLSLLSVRSDTIRLTASAASVPITVVRNTTYPVTVEIHLTSDKLQFPAGRAPAPGAVCHFPTVQSSAGRSTYSASCLLDHTTNAVYVNMRARTSGDFRLDVTLTSPGGGLFLAGGHLTVRSISTSAVAIVLSAVAGLVLLAWWGRTLWRGKWGRRGSHARGARARS